MAEAEDTGSNLGHGPPPKKNNQKNSLSEKLRRETRPRLIAEVEKAIGRKLVFKGVHFNIKDDDETPPNLYKWRFTPEYPHFPKKSVNKWVTTASLACLEALDKGHLSVIALPIPEVDVDQHPLGGAEEILHEDRQASPTGNEREETTLSTPAIGSVGHEDTPHQTVRLGALISSIDDWTSSHRSHLRKTLNLNAIDQIVQQINLELESNPNIETISDIKEMITDSRKRTSQLEQAVIDTVKKYFKKRIQRLDNLDTKVFEKVLKDNNDIETEICRLREGSPRFSSVNLRQELEILRSSQAIELLKAKEQGKKEGREAAMREDDNLNALLEENNVNIGRKAREMKAIYRNWNNIPQNLLPDSMLPEGKIPGDKTLILLARLSRIERSPQKAIALLHQEINRRNQAEVGARNDFITNGDIARVISSLDEYYKTPEAKDSSVASHLSSTSVRERLSTESVEHQFPERGYSSANRAVSDRTRQDPCTASIQIQPHASNTHNSTSGSQPRKVSFSEKMPSDARDSGIPPEKPHNGENKSSVHSPSSARLSLSQHLQFSLDRDSTPRRLSRTAEVSKENSHSKIPDIAMMGAGATKIPIPLESTEVSIIFKIIRSLELPPPGTVPPTTTEFPLDFIRDYIGGKDGTFTKSSAAMREKQVVDWPEHIRINLDIHGLGPIHGRNGALTFLDGRGNTGEVGKTYPVLLKTNPGFLAYIGHYTVVKRVIVPLEEWLLWGLGSKLAMAEEIEKSQWGRAVLDANGLDTNSTLRLDRRVGQILSFFARKEPPYLRMNWTLLQFTGFEKKDYKTLATALLKATACGDLPVAEIHHNQTASLSRIATHFLAPASEPSRRAQRRDTDTFRVDDSEEYTSKASTKADSASRPRRKVPPPAPENKRLGQGRSEGFDDIYDASPPPNNRRKRALDEEMSQVPSSKSRQEEHLTAKRQKFGGGADSVDDVEEAQEESLVDSVRRERIRYAY